MTEELIFYDDISDINSLESIPKSNNNHNKIAFNFGSHKALNEKNLSHEFKSTDIFKASDTMVDSLTQLIARKRDKNNI